jgi:hypothetical protein
MKKPFRCRIRSGLALTLGAAALCTPALAQLQPASPLSLHLGSPGGGLNYSLPGATSAWGVTPGQVDVTGRGRMGWTDLSVMGDYYILGSGFRASGGLMMPSQRTHAPWPGLAARPLEIDTRLGAGTLPYLGLGYSGTITRAQGSPWGFFADVGVVMLKPRSSVRLGSAGTVWMDGARAATLDEGGRDWRFSPLIQLGVSYSF